MQSATVQALVQTGFEFQNQGDHTRAEAAYREALVRQPEHAAALQLLGGLLRRRGDVVQAEALLRRSLAADPRQPHVWNNLGNLLHVVGKSTEALDCFDHALAQAAPTPYADAHYNRARVLHALSRLQEAAASLNQALALSPRHTIGMLQLQAQIEGDSGLVTSALATLDKALLLAPDKLALLHNRAVLLQRSHRHDEALAMHERAAALGLDTADTQYNRGNTLQSLGRYTDALAAYRRALGHDPGHALALFDLARLRWRLGESEFDAELRSAVAADLSPSLLPGIHAHLLWRAERHADAACAYRLALRRTPAVAGLLDGLGRSLVRLGDFEAGLQAHRDAVAAAPHDAELRSNHAASLLVAGQPKAALVEAEAACAQAPEHQQAQALRVLTWRLLGDPRANAMCDVQRFVQVFDLPPPPGFADMASFNAALARELAALHGDRRAPVDQTLRGGTQTLGDIFEQGHPLVDALKARIAEAVDRYVTGLPQDSAHPFLGRHGARGWRYADSWSSRLSQLGFHTDHVHPHGWISSAYYVAVPDGVAEHPHHEGWLQFGRPDLPLPDVSRDALIQRLVAPQPGRLVLFPSMLWHGTMPFSADGERLTIAFDVVPV